MSIFCGSFPIGFNKMWHFPAILFLGSILTTKAAALNGSSSGPNICLTKICTETSATILESMDLTINPCDNFYEFACGKFVKNAIIPDDKKQLSNFHTLQDKVFEQLHAVLNERQQLNDSKSIKLAKTFYNSCMNREAAEGAQPLIELIESFGGWPVVKGDTWNAEHWDLIELIGKLSKAGFDTGSILTVVTRRHPKDVTQNLLLLDRPPFAGRKDLLKNVRIPYHNYMIDAAVYFGANRTVAEQEMEQVFELEMELANAFYPTRKARSSILKVFTIRELQEKFSYLDWLRYIRSILPNDVIVNENQTVALGILEYFEILERILNHTSPRTITNYLIWRTVSATSKTLNRELYKLNSNYVTALHGTQKQISRHMECVSYTNEYFSIPVGELYIRKYFNAESKAVAAGLVDEVREALKKILRDLPWMDNQTRNAAIRKANTMNSFVAYPDGTDDEVELENYYNGFEMETNNFFKNILHVMRFNKDKEYRKLHHPINEGRWLIRSNTASVNAFNLRNDNSIHISAAILQHPFFDAQRPSYMNYGSIGQIIAHEITHSFDVEGRQYDWNGNLVNWWQWDTEWTFAAKAVCFIDQYSNFTTSAGEKLDGLQTLGENIADNGGLKSAYKAYKNTVLRDGPEPLLPGLNYTQQQLFWISAAQTWCAAIRPEYLRTAIATDVHSPQSFRVLGMLRNIPDFSEDFQCPLESKMNPSRKCRVW